MPRRRYLPGTHGPTAAGASPAFETPRDPEAQLPQSLDELFNASYHELCRLAVAIRRADAHATISTRTLVNETWMKLARSGTLGPRPQLHLKHIVAKAMRQYLIQAARHRGALKHGGDSVFVTLDDTLKLPVSSDRELLALDDALDELAQMNPRQAKLIDLRFFAGFDVAEAAEALDVSEETALRDWKAAKAWLATKIRPRH